MVYRLLGGGVVGRAYHKVQDAECLVLVQKFYLIMGLVHLLLQRSTTEISSSFHKSLNLP